MKKKQQTWVHYVAMGTGMGATFAGLVAGGYFLGSFIDGRWSSYPLWTLVLLIAALVLGLVWMIFMSDKLMRSADTNKQDDHNER